MTICLHVCLTTSDWEQCESGVFVVVFVRWRIIMCNTHMAHFCARTFFLTVLFFSHFPIILVTLIYGYGNFFIDKRGIIQVVKSHCEIVNIKIGEMYWNVAIDPHRSIDFIQRESGLIHNHTDFSFRLVSFETRSGLNMFVTKWTLPFIWLKRNTFFALILHGIHTN